MKTETTSDLGSGVVVGVSSIVEDALRRAAHELVDVHGWNLDGNRGFPEPFNTSEFFVVMAKHMAPLVNVDSGTFVAARIEALKAELRSLEG